MGRQRFSAEEVEAQRAQLVSAAERLFAVYGYEGVTLRGIAKSLGRSHTAAYRYFGGKSEIFAAARIAAYDRFAERQEQVAREVDEPRERLACLGAAYVQFAIDEPDAYRLMFELKPPPEVGSDAMSRAEERTWLPLRDSIVAAVDAGLLAHDPEQLAHLFWAALHGIVSLHLAGKLTHGLSLEELREPMQRLVFAGGQQPHPEDGRDA